MDNLLNSFSQDGGSHQFTLADSNPLVSSTSLISKRVAVERHLSSGTVQCSVPQVEEVEGQQTGICEPSSLLPPFPSREFSLYQGIGDPQSKPLFGVNMKQNGLSNLQSNGNGSNSLSMSFACSSLPGATGTDYPPTYDLTTTSCVDASGLLQTSENVGLANPSTGTFVKVSLMIIFLVVCFLFCMGFSSLLPFVICDSITCLQCSYGV